MEEDSRDSVSIEKVIADNTHSCLKPKKVMFIRGNNSNLVTTLFLKDFSRLKKVYSVYLGDKYDIKPFEDATAIEDLAREQNCPLFMFSSHNKKRPNNIIIGRLSEEDHSLKEMIEFGIDDFHSMQEIKGLRLPVNPRLCLVFGGSAFQECNDYRLFKEIISEFFQGHSRTDDKLSKVDYFIKLTSDKEGNSKFECSRVIPRYKSSKVCKIEYADLGPNFEFFIRRVKLFSSDNLMDIPEETPDEILVKSDCDDNNLIEATNITDTNLNNNNNNHNKPILTNGDNVNCASDRGIKRNHDDLNERLKRMKFN